MIRTADRASVTRDLYRHSSTVYTALAVNGRTGQSDCVHFAARPDDPALLDAIHFWQLDDLRHTNLQAAVTRAHSRLRTLGWTDAVLRSGLESETWARHPHEPYAVHLLTISDLRRIAVSVTSAPFRPTPLVVLR